jgi:hypothetical protein
MYSKPISLTRFFLLALIPWIIMLGAGCWGNSNPGDLKQNSKSTSSTKNASTEQKKSVHSLEGVISSGDGAELLSAKYPDTTVSSTKPVAKGKGTVTYLEAPWIQYTFTSGDIFKMQGVPGNKLSVKLNTDDSTSKNTESAINISSASSSIQKTIAAFAWQLYAIGIGVIVCGFALRYLNAPLGWGTMLLGGGILVVLRAVEAYPEHCFWLVVSLAGLVVMGLGLYAIVYTTTSERYKRTVVAVTQGVEAARLELKGTSNEAAIKTVTDQVETKAAEMGVASSVKKIVTLAKTGKLL